MKFGFNRPVVSEDKMFENIDNTHTYTHTFIRTTEAYLSCKLTTEPKGSGELKSTFFITSQIKCVLSRKRSLS